MRFVRLIAFALVVVLSSAQFVSADPVIPANILNPKSAAEAWNVIRLVTKNVELLLDENRLTEVPVQISYCSPALRALPRMVAEPQSIKQVKSQIVRAFTSVNAVAISAQQNNLVGAKSALASFRSVLDNVAQSFDPKPVGADIFFCPMHSDFRVG